MQWLPSPESKARAASDERHPSPCPGDDLLFSLALGDVDEKTQGSIEAHVRECQDCRDILSEALRSLTRDAESSSDGQKPTQVLLDRYELLEAIGSGGAGVVYRSFDPALKREVAVKLLRPDLPGSNDEFQARLREEAQATAQLSHPNVVTAYDVGATETGAFIVLEYFSGGTLEEWLHGDHSLDQRLRVMIQAGRGLAAAHEKGLVHRDFKPQNVLLSKDHRVCVTDFGLARLDDVNHSRSFQMNSTIGDATETRGLMGTPNYMAPEVFAGSRGDELSDQFSFSVALYQAVNGRHPFRGARDTTLAELLVRVQSGMVDPASPGVPENIRKVIERGLSADPRGRFNSMTELLSALEPSPARSLSVKQVAVATASLIVLGSAIWFVVTGNSEPSPQSTVQEEPRTQSHQVPVAPPKATTAAPPRASDDAVEAVVAEKSVPPPPPTPAPTPRPSPPPQKKRAAPVAPASKPAPASGEQAHEARFKDRLRNPF